jgi:hypothetical protein
VLAQNLPTNQIAGEYMAKPVEIFPQHVYEPKFIKIPYFYDMNDPQIPDGTEAQFIVIRKIPAAIGNDDILQIEEFLPFRQNWFQVDLKNDKYFFLGKCAGHGFSWSGRLNNTKMGSNYAKVTQQYPHEADIVYKRVLEANVKNGYGFGEDMRLGNMEIHHFNLQCPPKNRFTDPIIWLKDGHTENNSGQTEGDYQLLKDTLANGKYIAVTPSTADDRPQGWVIFYRRVWLGNDSIMLRIARPFDEKITPEKEFDLAVNASVEKIWNADHPENLL